MDAVAIVEDEVRELVRRRGLDPSREPGVLRALVEDVVADYDERSLLGTLPRLPEQGGVVKRVLDAVGGLGPLQEHLDDPEVEEIWINEPGKVFVARGGRPELTTTILSREILCASQASRHRGRWLGCGGPRWTHPTRTGGAGRRGTRTIASPRPYLGASAAQASSNAVGASLNVISYRHG